jgi:hypothetical protein
MPMSTISSPRASHVRHETATVERAAPRRNSWKASSNRECHESLAINGSHCNQFATLFRASFRRVINANALSNALPQC